MFDGLVRRTVFAQADGIVRIDENHLNMRERGEANCRAHIVGKRLKRAAVGNQAAV